MEAKAHFGKKAYQAPQAWKVVIDTQISLAMISSPPDGPDESNYLRKTKTEQPQEKV